MGQLSNNQPLQLSALQLMNVPLSDVLRSEIAMPLKHMMNLYTVGGLLRAWDEPGAQRCIEQVFESPDQARAAVAACAAWCGQAPLVPLVEFGWLACETPTPTIG